MEHHIAIAAEWLKLRDIITLASVSTSIRKAVQEHTYAFAKLRINDNRLIKRYSIEVADFHTCDNRLLGNKPGLISILTLNNAPQRILRCSCDVLIINMHLAEYVNITSNATVLEIHTDKYVCVVLHCENLRQIHITGAGIAIVKNGFTIYNLSKGTLYLPI